MAKRIIRTGVGTYLDPNGLHQFGLMGAEVEVHEDDLERFDGLNPADPEQPESDRPAKPTRGRRAG